MLFVSLVEPGKSPYSEDRWWSKEGDDLGSCVWELGSGLAEDQSHKLERAKAMLCLYQGGEIDLGVLGARLPDYEVDDIDYGLIQTLCDTAHAEIAGRQKPVPKFQTSDADWKTKRRAKRLEKFCQAQMHQQQGTFLNVWEAMESCFLDAAIMQVGVLKVFPDMEEKKICTERHFFHELHVDPIEAKYGAPQNLFHVYTMERDKLIEAFASDEDMSAKKRDEIIYAIETAPEGERMADAKHYGRVARSVKVVEAWRLPRGKGKPGKHVFAIENKLLFEEDWERPEFPFVFIRWNTDRIGWGSKSLSEEVESIHREINEMARKLQERMRLCGSKRTFYEDGSLDEEDLQANEAEVFVKVRKGAQLPKETKPSPLAESEVEYLRMQLEMGFRRSGVSEMRASARKEPGVDSGVAIRTLNDMQTARFALKAKAYENAYVQLARQLIYCAREMSEAGVEVVARHESEKIDWSNVHLPEDSYDITIAPTASLPNDPAGRMQMAQELYANQLIGAETFKQLLGWPDLEKEMNHQTAQTRWVEKIIDQMLDYEAGEDGEESDDVGYQPPDGMIADKPGAMLQVVNAYFEALYNDAPELNLSLLRRWIQEIDHQIQEAEKAMQQAQMELQMQAQQMMGGGQAPPQAQGVA